MIIQVNAPDDGPLTSVLPIINPDCLVCETDVEIDTAFTFSSTTAQYQLLTSHSQLVGRDYSSWVSTCSGEFIYYLKFLILS